MIQTRQKQQRSGGERRKLNACMEHNGGRVASSELVSRLRRKALKLQKLRSVASEQVMDAELAYEDITRQCKEAWDEYHNARKQEPANVES